MNFALLAPLGGLVVTLGVLTILLVGRRALARRSKVELEKAVASGRHIPASLHPVIDTDICIGSLSCLKACPEGDILGVIDNTARLVHADRCIGHGRCAVECPVGAIKLVFGTAERGVDLPEVDEFFESSRPGVHVVGELGGMGLIKNAVGQGLQVAERLNEVLGVSVAGATGDAEFVDVVIVGAGPAGLATAAGLQQRERTFRIVDQSTLGGTVAHYPRQKVVMTEPVELPFVGRLGKSLVAKEELLADWKRLVEKGRIHVEEGVKVTGLAGSDGGFNVFTEQGPIAARKVVLACGRRGSPRKLGVPGEEQSKVAYSLIEAEQYDGCSVLVVGGGDSALEAAASLAEQSTAQVAISYRGEAFARCRERNREKIGALEKSGRVQVLLGTQVKQIDAERVVLTRTDGSLVELPNDFVIVQAGGELPLEFLKQMGVEVRRFHGEAPGEHSASQKRRRAGLAKERDVARDRRITGLLYAGTGLLILAWLASMGWEYYVLPHRDRLHSALHQSFRPAGHIGHGIGIGATLVMMSNFLYAVRKRTRALTGLGSIRGWLDFHMFVGFMSPLVIVFHAAFQFNNQLATGTAAALLIVVSTGIVGRYIYGLVPTERGRALELSDLRARVARIQERTLPLLEDAKDREPLEALLQHALPPESTQGGSALGLIARLCTLPFAGAMLRLRLQRGRWLFAERDDFRDFRDALLRLHRLRVQIGFFGALKAVMRTWRLFHAVLAVLLVFVIAAHIGVSLYLGYGWKR